MLRQCFDKIKAKNVLRKVIFQITDMCSQVRNIYKNRMCQHYIDTLWFCLASISVSGLTNVVV